MITSKQLNRLRDEAYATACNKGFHDEKHSDEHWLMLVITEIAEAVQADRKGRRVTRKVREDYEQFMEAYNDISITMYESAISGTLEDELADIVIRLLDFCGMNGYSFDYRLITPEEYFMRDFTYFAWCLCRNILDRREELVVWSVIKYCEKHGIDILWHIEQKMEYNKMRPRMHNAKY